MSKSYKNIPSLHHYVESAPLDAIKNLIVTCPLNQDTHPFGAIDWPSEPILNGTGQEVRLGILEICASLEPKAAATLDGHSRRIISLSKDKGVEAIQVVRDRLYKYDDADSSLQTQFSAQHDDFGRATVVYLRAPELFEEAEQYFYAEHHRNNGKLYEGFDVDCDDISGFEWTDEKRNQLETALEEKLGLGGPCKVQHLPFNQTQPDGQVTAVHLFLIRHAGDTNSVQEINNDLSTQPIYYRPPVEVTIVFQPERKSVEVFCEQQSSRMLIAASFAQTAVNTDLSGRPVTMRQYNLTRFYSSLSLPQDVIADLDVLDVRVLEAEARPQNYKRRVSLKIDKTDDIEEATRDLLGDNNIFTNAALISRVVINMRFMKDGKEANVPITLTTPNRCNLASRREPQERELGFAILERYGIMTQVAPLTANQEASQFSAMLKLYEADDREVRRRMLEQWGANVEVLLAGGFLKPMVRAMDVTHINDDGTPVLLTVRTVGENLIAEDPVTHDPIEIHPDELQRFEVMRGWLNERIIKGLVGAMRMGQRPKAEASVTKLGILAIGNDDIPVYLARRLNRLDIISEVEAYLRGEGQIGYGVVLTATEFHPEYLGANVVVSLQEVLEGDADEITIDQARLLQASVDGKNRAQAATTVELIIHSDIAGKGSATLLIPGKDPWALLGKQILIIDRLVNAYRANNPVLQGGVLFEGMGYNGPGQAFKGETWKTYFGHPQGTTRGWTLFV